MDFAAGLFPSDDDAEGSALAVSGGDGDAGDGEAFMCLAPNPAPFVGGSFGHGRHGSQLEKERLCSHMRERRAQKSAERVASFLGDRAASVLADPPILGHRKVRTLWSRGQKRIRAKTLKVALQASKLVVARDPHGRAVSHDDIIDLSLGKLCRKNVQQAAACLGLSPTWIRTCRVVAASGYLHWQGKTFGHLVMLAQRHRPQLVVCRTAWDETGQRLRTHRPELSTEQHIGTWQVMVCRQRLVVVWPSRAAVEVDVTLPPCIVPSPSAANLYAGLFHNPTTKHIFAARELLFGFAAKGVDITETDAATANYRIEAHLSGRRTHKTSKDHFACRLHQHHIIECTVMCTAGDNALSRMYSFSSLMRSSNYYMRLVLSIPSALLGAVVQEVDVQSALPSDLAAYHDELAQYMFVHANRFRAAQDQRGVVNLCQEQDGSGMGVDSESDDEGVLATMLADKRNGRGNAEHGGHVGGVRRGGRSQKYKAELMQDCVNIFGMWNGPLWSPTPVHECRGCCSGPAEAKKKMCQVARALLFRRRPQVPALNKWNKLGPVLDFLLALMLVHSLLSKCFGHEGAARSGGCSARRRGRHG